MYQSLMESRSLWLHLAGKDLKSRFRGTSLGLIWLFVNLIFTFTATAFIWSTLFKLNFLNFLIYIGCGFSVWALITSITIGGSTSILTAISMFLNSTTKLIIAPGENHDESDLHISHQHGDTICCCNCHKVYQPAKRSFKYSGLILGNNLSFPFIGDTCIFRH